ncbi:hypothetical protein [Citrobacter freundii]|uniref:hypothetical protein n=1 Tax=Citrobacter freundii TaxID=546 RepID=UPI00388DB916|nr:hypothetical protein [Citrobacter freundii]
MSNKFSFAHLLGLNKAAKASRASDDDDKDDDDTNAVDDDDNDGDKDDSSKNGKKGKKAKKANDNDDDADADNDDADADDDDDDADADDDDDDADAEEDENKDVKKGRKAERERCAAIFSSRHAAGRPDLAATLAFTTKLSAKEAIRVMRANGRTVTGAAVQLGQPKRQTLQDRMANEPHPKIGVNGGKSGGSTAEKMMSLYNRTTGSDKK